MKFLNCTLACFLISISAFSQQDILKNLVDSGVALTDKGQYDAAIALYDQVIKESDTYYDAYYEKSYTFLYQNQNQECIQLCEQIIKKFPDNDHNQGVYSNYGSALDNLGQHDKAIKIYNKGIKKYPETFLLYLNRGITEFSQKDLSACESDMKKVIQLKPLRASGHMYLGYIAYGKNKIASAMSLTTFLLLEPNSNRSKKNLKLLLQLLNSHVEENDEKTINLSLPSNLLDTRKKGEDDFHSEEFLMSLTSASDYTENYKDLDPAKQTERKLEIFAGVVVTKRSKGFFTYTYVPFFRQLKSDSLLETACYILYSSTADPRINKWLSDHEDKVTAFNTWMQNYQWRKDD